MKMCVSFCTQTLHFCTQAAPMKHKRMDSPVTEERVILSHISQSNDGKKQRIAHTIVRHCLI